MRGQDEGYLRCETTGKQCCIGFLARQVLGCKIKEIKGVGPLNGIMSTYKESVSQFIRDHSQHLEAAYAVNDDPAMEDTDRIKKLRDIGRSMGIRFVFGE